ncbi:MAG: DUF86 domain-containing protein [Methanobacteriota archaeon]
MNPPDRIVTISADLNRFFRDYSILIESGIPDEQDTVRYHALSMVLFIILNLCFEMGEEVISSAHTQIPQSYRDIFRILHKENIIDESMMQTMSGLVYYRNRLAHQYAGLDSEDLKAICRKIDIVHEYIEILKRKVPPE